MEDTRSPAEQPAVRPAWPRILLLVACVIAAYANSCRGPFIFDDRPAIENNPTIRDLGNIRRVLSPPRQTTVAGRPVLNLSLALNHAVGGLDPRGYHVANTLIHLLGGLLLFGVVRRTLCFPRFRERFGGIADDAAFAAAVLWLVHPLQTESVTYVIQRAESLMGLFYLGSVYAALRSFEGSRRLGWKIIAVISMWLAAGVKEVAATIPVAILLFDVILGDARPVDRLRRRPMFYGALAAGWLITLSLLLSDPRGIGHVREGIGPVQYLVNQPGSILTYLRLALYPRPLVLDYGEPAADSTRDLLLPGGFILFMLAATALLLWRRRLVGLPMGLFFLMLAPTSSIVPQADLIFEHRMYLPLACVTALIAVGGCLVLSRVSVPVRLLGGGIALAVIVLVLGVLTVLRNRDYRSAESIFADTVAKRPDCARAHLNLAQAIHAERRYEEAAGHYLKAVTLNPRMVEPYYNSGLLLLDVGDPKKAAEFLRKAIQLKPDFAAAHNSLGSAYARQGMKAEARTAFDEALRLDPGDPEVWINQGNLALEEDDLVAARKHYEHALGLSPMHSGALAGVGTVCARENNLSDAIHFLTRAVRIDPANAPAQQNLKLAEEALRQQRSEAIKAATSGPPAP